MKPTHKIIFIIWVTAMLLISKSYAQTPIAPSTSVGSLSTMKKGVYTFYNGKDSIYFSIDTGTVVKIVKVPVFPTIDSAGIIKTYLVLHPCPAIPKQRTAIGLTEMTTSLKKTLTITYDDGTSTNF